MASSDAEVRQHVEIIESAWDEPHLVQLNKAWDLIHRCLSNGTLDSSSGGYPLNRAILNGRQLFQGDEYIVSFVTPAEVQDVAAVLLNIGEAWFRDRFNRLRDSDFPQMYLDSEEGYEEMFEFTWTYFQDAQDFYQDAAKGERAVIFTADQ